MPRSVSCPCGATVALDHRAPRLECECGAAYVGMTGEPVDLLPELGHSPIELSIEAAARTYGRGSPQHQARRAYLYGRCPNCDGPLEDDGEAGDRWCARCGRCVFPQWREEDGFPKPTTMIVSLPVVGRRSGS